MGQLAIIETIKDPHKNNFNDFIADLSDDIREKFLTSLSDNEINTVVDLGYLLVSQTMLFSPLSLS